MRKLISCVITMLLLTAAASAQSVTIREIRQQSIAKPTPDLSASTMRQLSPLSLALTPRNNADGPMPFTFYPVAGTFGKDLFIATLDDPGNTNVD